MEQLAQKEKRLGYIDAAKAIAMISVVVFHSCTNAENTYLATNAYLIRFLSAFAMPVFFFINGFLYKNKNLNNPVREVLRKVKNYYLPFLAYNLFYLLAHNVFVKLHFVDETFGNGHYSMKDYAKHFVLAVTGHREYFAGALWFLGSILIISAIVIGVEWILNLCGKIKYRFAVLAVVTVILHVLSYLGVVPDAMKLSESCSSFLYFFFGMLYREFRYNEFFTKNRFVWIGVAVVLNLLVSYNKLYLVVAANSALILHSLDVVNALLGIVAVMMIVQFKPIENSRILNIVGTNTMDIMGLHFLMFKLVSCLIVMVYAIPTERLAEYPVLFKVAGAWWILYTVVGVVLPVCFGIARKKIKAKLIKK